MNNNCIAIRTVKIYFEAAFKLGTIRSCATSSKNDGLALLLYCETTNDMQLALWESFLSKTKLKSKNKNMQARLFKTATRQQQFSTFLRKVPQLLLQASCTTVAAQQCRRSYAANTSSNKVESVAPKVGNNSSSSNAYTILTTPNFRVEKYVCHMSTIYIIYNFFYQKKRRRCYQCGYIRRCSCTWLQWHCSTVKTL